MDPTRAGVTATPTAAPASAEGVAAPARSASAAAPAAPSGGGPQPWSAALPHADAASVAADGRRVDTGRLLAAQAPLLREIAEALRRTWPPRPRRVQGLELALVRPDGSRDKRLLQPRVIRVGRDASCHLQLGASTVSREHCEIQVDEDGKLAVVDLDSTSGTKVNGYALEPFVPRPLVSGDQIEIHPFRIVVGAVATVEDESEATLRPTAPLHLAGSPFARLGAASDLWVRVASGADLAWVALPTAWLGFAYRVLGYPPPEHPDPANEVDRALTRHLLQRAAAVAGERLGRAVQVAGPFAASEAMAGETLPAAWDGARLVLALGGVESELVAVWPAREAAAAGIALPPWLAGLPYSVAVELGSVVLPAASLAAVESGDALVPDHWFASRWREPDGPGGVRLRTDGGERPARLRRAGDGAGDRLELVVESTWTLTPRGAAMAAENPPDRAELESRSAPAPLRVPEDLEALVTFELDRVEVPVGELARWSSGLTVPLDRGPDDPVRIVLHQGGSSRLLGTGRVLVVDGRLGVRIDQWLVEPRG